jgi:hypothetical protein
MYPSYKSMAHTMNCLPTHFGTTLNVSVVKISQEPKLAFKSTNVQARNIADDISNDDFVHWTKDARDIATLALRNPSQIGNWLIMILLRSTRGVIFVWLVMQHMPLCHLMDRSGSIH